MSTPSDDDFLQELRETFTVEAGEHLQTLSRGLVELEAGQRPDLRDGIVEAVFRAAHSLKGAARAVEMGEVESTCQLLEDVLARLKREHSALPAEAADVLHRALDAIGAMVASPATAAPAPAVLEGLRALAVAPWPAAARPAGVVSSSAAGVAVAQSAAVAEPPVPAEGTVRVAMPKLEAQLLKTEELLAAKLATGQRMRELRELSAWFVDWRKTWAAVEGERRTLRRGMAQGPAADAAAHRAVQRLLDFCEWGDGAVRMLENRIDHIGRSLRQDHDVVNRNVDSALDGAKALLLLPFSTLCAPFPKLLRDLCRAEGKEADLTIHGEHVELEKRILEALKDPLMHLLRNAVDHGVEPPAQRLLAGKPRRAALVLSVTQLGGDRVQVTLTDDGIGIDPGTVRAAAVRAGLVSQAEADALDDAAAQALVFRSSLSTGSRVTALSGRGLGMAIVQEHAQQLGGEVRLDSTPGQGTRICIVVPSVRATFRGVLCEVAQRHFLLPACDVERVACLPSGARFSLEGRAAVRIGTRTLALVRLADVLALPAAPAKAGTGLHVVVVGSGEQAIALQVDAVLEEREVLLKPLRKPLVRVRNIASAAVLGSGVLVPVLKTADLLKSAPQAGQHAAQGVLAAVGEAGGAGRGEAPQAGRRVLVAEDSITSRLLLKSILQNAGYKVSTAVDGAEALALLRTEPFDLLVSDVEMPRLNGFDLTARLRGDSKLAELPVVLVTALATREDKERGADVGANAYVVKGSFDQDDLLAAVERLIA